MLLWLSCGRGLAGIVVMPDNETSDPELLRTTRLEIKFTSPGGTAWRRLAGFGLRFWYPGLISGFPAIIRTQLLQSHAITIQSVLRGKRFTGCIETFLEL